MLFHWMKRKTNWGYTVSHNSGTIRFLCTNTTCYIDVHCKQQNAKIIKMKWIQSNWSGKAFCDCCLECYHYPVVLLIQLIVEVDVQLSILKELHSRDYYIGNETHNKNVNFQLETVHWVQLSPRWNHTVPILAGKWWW